MSTTAEKKAAFEASLLHVLKGWTCLALAVEQGWGGRHSERKREELYLQLLSFFYANPHDLIVSGNKKCTANSVIGTDESLADWLLNHMETKFHVQVEDEGEYLEVARIIRNLGTSLKNGDFTFYEKIMKLETDGVKSSVCQPAGGAAAYGIDPSQSLFAAPQHQHDAASSSSESDYADEEEVVREAERQQQDQM